ncbi:MAG TPA: ribonuclease HII [Candidatus Paceibacterota bacterium]
MTKQKIKVHNRYKIQDTKYYTIGIDEVGRGALAGPIAVAAVAIPYKLRLRNLKDSKRLRPSKREEWFMYAMQNQSILYSVRRIYPNKIDRINISSAANLAAHRAVEDLMSRYGLRKSGCRIYLDGGLYIKNKEYQRHFAAQAKTFIKGDEKINAVKLASVIAKVSRDRYMQRLHPFYPEYGFYIHKGYGTLLHREAIKRHGPSNVHRLTFIKKVIA